MLSGSRVSAPLANRTGTVPRPSSSRATHVSPLPLRDKYPDSRPFSSTLPRPGAYYSCSPPIPPERYSDAGLLTGQSDRTAPNSRYRTPINYSFLENAVCATAYNTSGNEGEFETANTCQPNRAYPNHSIPLGIYPHHSTALGNNLRPRVSFGEPRAQPQNIYDQSRS